MRISTTIQAAALLATFFATSACQATGSMLGKTIADLDEPFAQLDRLFDT